MNKKKGQITIGGLIIMLVVAVVAIVLFTATAQTLGPITNSQALNKSFVTPAVDGVIDLDGQELLSTPVVVDNGTGVVVGTGNYTIAEGISATTGLKSITYTVLDSQYGSENATAVNISYTFGADGYIDSAGGRSIAGIILIFAGLAIAVTMLVPTLRSGIIESVKNVGGRN